MVDARSADTPTGRVDGMLHVAPWALLGLGAVTAAVLPGPSSGTLDRITLVVTLGLFFLALVTRLLRTAAQRPARRVPLLFLAAGVTMWAVGSATVSARQTVGVVPFPAPGEVLVFASYIAIAAFLLADLPRGGSRRITVWLEAAIICGAAVCLAAFFLLTPLVRTFGENGLALLMAVLYPLINLVMFGAVLGRMLVHRRDRSLPRLGLLTGFLGLGVADSTFLLAHAAGTYSTSLLVDAVWGVSFALIVAAACADQRPAPGVDSVERQSSPLLALAAGLAVAVLVLDPPGVVGWSVKIPALVTLLCSGARMVLALREARGAAEALRLSLTDELTGLPNRRALLAAVERGLATPGPVALLLLDMDGFKDVNDSLGHTVGDEVLVTLAQRMRWALDPEVMIARLGGDEFALLVHGTDELELVELAQSLRDVLRLDLHVQGLVVSLDASVGVTVREEPGTSPAELLRRADVAMYRAKQLRAGVLLFDPTHDGNARHRLRAGEALRQAVNRGELEVWYQPQVDARTRKVIAVEALVRWRHPTDGVLTPIDFLTDAREAGLMPAITEHLLRTVIADARAWADAGLTFRVGMNWAPPEIGDPRLLDTLVKAVSASGLPRERLIVEVTEDSFLAEPQRAREALLQLRRYGIQVAIDDYGTGFSSLAYLRDLPVQELKIDRSFISQVVWDARSRMIVQATAQMARALGLRLVAEGVEDPACAAELVPMGVDVLQGFYIARPMPREAVTAWVHDWRAAHDPHRIWEGAVDAV